MKGLFFLYCILGLIVFFCINNIKRIENEPNDDKAEGILASLIIAISWPFWVVVMLVLVLIILVLMVFDEKHPQKKNYDNLPKL